jgi:hypothetical protein
MLGLSAGVRAADTDRQLRCQREDLVHLWIDPAKLTKPETIRYIRCELQDAQTRMWNPAGNFTIKRDPQGRVTGGRFDYRVPKQGIYRFRSVAVSTENEFEIKPLEDAEAIVIVDWTPPVIQLQAPAKPPGEAYHEGEKYPLVWVAHDPGGMAASGPAPEAVISVSFDGGDTWPARYRKTITLSDTSGWMNYDWEVPRLADILHGKKDEVKRIDVVSLKIQMTDAAGNPAVKETRMFPISEPGADIYPHGVETVADGKSQTKLPPDVQAKFRGFYQRGAIYLLRADYDEAADEFEHALKLNPDYVPVLSDLAISEFMDGRRDKAIDRLAAALKNDTLAENIQLKVTYGWLLTRRNAKDDRILAWNCLREIIFLKPVNDRDKRLRLKAMGILADMAYDSGLKDQARSLWHRILEEAPTGSDLRADAHKKLGG